MTTPHQEAHYWAKQTRSDTGNEPSERWEVVQTFENSMGGPFELRVFVPGQSESESVDCFIWGPIVVPPKGCES